MANATVRLIGRLVNDPEFREGKDQREFVTFRMAVNQQFGANENASFFNCAGGEAMAKRIRKAGLTKGRLIALDGSLTLREYITRDTGEKRLSPDVGIYDWSYVGGKPKTDDQGNPEQAPAEHPAGVRREESTIHDDDDLPL